MGFSHATVAWPGRQWCWMGMKEFGCHRVLDKRYTWAEGQQLAAAVGVAPSLSEMSTDHHSHTHTPFCYRQNVPKFQPRGSK